MRLRDIERMQLRAYEALFFAVNNMDRSDRSAQVNDARAAAEFARNERAEFMSRVRSRAAAKRASRRAK